jgi:predicted nucleic acid-binding protein
VTSYDVLVDSDAFVAWSMPDDYFHQTVQAVFERLARDQARLVTTSWVIAETATVLSHRSGQTAARLFLERLASLNFPVVHITEALQNDATGVFKAQSARGVSMVDCGNVAVMQRFAVSEILSFDRFYSRLSLKMTPSSVEA